MGPGPAGAPAALLGGPVRALAAGKPKLKTRKAVSKRFKLMGSGHLKRWQTGKQHNFSNKSRSRKSRLSTAVVMEDSAAHTKSMKRMMAPLGTRW